MIVTVFNYGSKTSVPITPHTTVSDIIECCRDPGDEHCKLICPAIEGKMMIVTSSSTKSRTNEENDFANKNVPLKDSDRPLEILQRWGSGRLMLRYTTLRANVLDSARKSHIGHGEFLQEEGYFQLNV
ncbi:hypothetical protein HUJ05_000643 [Dendroctonus ponderosae]|nr:hypothetical protein HUJ05_000643 [Dendroctonus ponderosae]